MKRSIFILILLCTWIQVSTAANDSTIVKSHNKVVVYAGNRNFPPFEFVNEKGEPDGFDIDLFVAVMKQLHLPYRIEMKEFRYVLADMKDGESDVASLMYSNSRAKIYLFGPTIKYSFLFAIYNKADKPVNSLEDFKGKKVVVEKGTLSDENITKSNIACKVIRVPNILDGLLGVSSGKYDVMLCPHDAAAYNIVNRNIKNLKQIDIGLPPSEICFSGTNVELVDAINKGLYQLKHQGIYDNLYNKWFSEEDNGKVSRIIYIVIASLLLLVFIAYVFIHILRIKVNQAKKSLRETNKYLTLALTAGDIIVWGYDVEKGRYYNIEPAIFPPEGRTIDEEVMFFHPDDRENYRNAIMAAINGINPPKAYCFRIDYTNTGDWKYIEKNIALVRNDNGKVIKLIGTHKNITTDVKHYEEMVKTQQELKREMMKAQEADRLKSEFLANMSHEIRTPLNSIVGFSSLLRGEMTPDDKNMCINLIEKNSDMLLRQVNDVLDFSKLEAGASTFQLTKLNLTELMTITHSSLKNQFKGKDIAFLIDTPYPKCMVTADYNRLRQVMTNFVTNAFKYTENGHVKMGYQCGEGFIKLYVEDTGIGIAEDKIEMVFNRFEKIGSFKEGTGLGLSICQAIAKRMNGKIGVDSQLGKGSTFWITVPLQYTITED